VKAAEPSESGRGAPTLSAAMAPILAAIRRFKARMEAGDTMLGLTIIMNDLRITEAVAATGLTDFFWLDLEHTPMSPEMLTAHLAIGRAHGVPNIVRVSGPDHMFIKWVRDAGADGIIVPQVNSAEEARQVVANCRYAPAGVRGIGPMIPTRYGQHDMKEYTVSEPEQ
jgi:2-keto-3-deoxy-L-rhamnonate aldolase RhmA